MKNTKKINVFTLIAVGLLSIFSACKKDKPTLEVQHEEYSKVEVTFTEGTVNASTNAFTATANINSQKVTFDSEGKSDATAPLRLTQGKSYQLSINFLDKEGHNVNEEFEEHADEHQIFFIPSTPGNNALSYTYNDENIGLTGIMRAVSVANTFDLSIALRHGIDKSKARAWNDANYTQYGESDFFGKVQLQVISQ